MHSLNTIPFQPIIVVLLALNVLLSPCIAIHVIINVTTTITHRIIGRVRLVSVVQIIMQVATINVYSFPEILTRMICMNRYITIVILQKNES